MTEPSQDLAGALHEVSNALTVVLGWLDVACLKLAPGEEREAIEVARTHAHLGQRIARTAIGAEAPGRGSTRRPARSVAKVALVGVRPQADERGVELVLDEGNEGHGLVRDVGAVLQILTNLLLNAVAFTPKGGKVRLTVHEDGVFATFFVTDQGPGIDPDRVETLFSSPNSTRRGGAGLGLRHSASLAESHGGELRLASHAPSCCFELSWPVAEALSRARSQPSRTPSVSGARVLVVEDDAAVRSLVELALEARGAQAIVVATGDEFDAILARGAPFDAALIDLSPLKGRAGEALDALRETSPDVVVILISGAASGVPDGLERHIAAWVRKPFEMSEVLEVMGNLLAAQRAPTFAPPEL
ncbi:MAG TPA: ATP-binding protein [Polyangiaceae bacterium]|nr:ATP-binding protein [Polyangiaceae bacterium]